MKCEYVVSGYASINRRTFNLLSNFTWGLLILGKTSKTIEDLAVTKEKEEQEKVKNKPRVTYSKVTSCVLIEEIRRFLRVVILNLKFLLVV